MTSTNRIILLLLLSSTCGYTQTDSLYFSVSSYHLDGKLYRTDTVSVKNTKKALDIYFYKEHFNMFYGLPKKLIRKEYKNQEIVECSNPNDDKANWSDSYTYDAQGRLIEYSYSSCDICSQFPWGYTLIYDKHNNVIEQETYFLSQTVTIEKGELLTNVKPNELTKECVQLTYDVKGNILLLEGYNHQEISKKILLLK